MSDEQEQRFGSAATPVEQPPEDAEGQSPGEHSRWRPDGLFRQVDPNYVQVEAIGCWIFTLLAAAGIVAAAAWVLLGDPSPGLVAAAAASAAGLLGLLVWLSVKYPQWEYRHLRYAVSDAGLEIHRGILWRRKINVPRSRIQHTDVTQGPLARQFGIATLQVYTAGTRDNQVDLEGLSYDTALHIRSHLVEDLRGDDI